VALTEVQDLQTQSLDHQSLMLVAVAEVKIKVLQVMQDQVDQAEAVLEEMAVLTLDQLELTVSVEAVAEAVKTARQLAEEVDQELLLLEEQHLLVPLLQDQ
tara:strand:+ start:107 stop:409 length:303 start_codon:yes stop_codon:yes gene_type:complete